MTQRPRCKTTVEAIDCNACPGMVAAVTSSCANPAILETLQPAHFAGRYSIFAADPIEVVAVEANCDAPLAHLAGRINCDPALTPVNHDLPFVGGWIGYVSYEAGAPNQLVGPREGKSGMPLLRFGLYDHALVFDHFLGQWWATAIEWMGCHSSRPHASSRLAILRERVQKAQQLKLAEPARPSVALATQRMTRAQYDSRVDRIKQYIEAGDIYQANLAQRFRIASDISPFDLYRRVRLENPCTYAAYIEWREGAILSASPELFLELRGDCVVTRPIKGTRPRTGFESDDTVSRNELATSEKEHSELNMIIDLLRNDLGRVCEYGSVRVSDTGSIEAHPTVFHRVATIEGRLTGGRKWYDLLQAAFPGGSIVGAPKIRAMQIIRELEPCARGPYCGAIGWIGLDGNMTLSIAIRTMAWREGIIDLFAGGAIVAESEADAEYEEILAKARGLLASLNAEPDFNENVRHARKVGVA